MKKEDEMTRSHGARREPQDINSQLMSLPAPQHARRANAPARDALLKDDDGDKILIQSVSRALDILEALAANPQAMKLNAIAEQTGLNVATCHHLLATLVHRGYISRHETSRSYQLGDQLFQLLRHQRQGTFDLVQVLLPEMRCMAQDMDETTTLAAFSGSQLTLLAQHPQEEHTLPTGWQTEKFAQAAHACALGKAMLAWLPETQIARIVADQGLTAFTPRSITSLADLVESLRQIRRHGFALEDEEWLPGWCGVACALRSQSGHVVGAVGCWLPQERASDARLKLLAQRVIQISQNGGPFLCSS